jgi:hypothetical protein
VGLDKNKTPGKELCPAVMDSKKIGNELKECSCSPAAA